MRSLLLFLVVSLLLPAWGKPTINPAPVRLTLTTDTPVVFGEAVALKRTSTATPWYTITPAKLTLTFTNTSGNPIKLNAYEMRLDRLRMTVSGTEAGSVVMQRLLLERTAVVPTATDYPTLQPGASWVYPESLAFPGNVGDQRVILQRPGSYTVTMTYANLPGPREESDKLAEGSFRGAAGSNALPIRLVDAGERNHGLQLAVDVLPNPAPESTEIALTGYVRNVSDAPITLRAWNLLPDSLALTGYDGKVISSTKQSLRSRVPTPEERYATLQPGEIRAFPLAGRYLPAEEGDAPSGTFTVTDSSGFTRAWPVQGGSVSATATLNQPDGDNAADAPGPLWTGTLAAPRQVVRFNLTHFRQRVLQQHLAQFALVIRYLGDQEKPFYQVRLQTAPVDDSGAFTRMVQLTDTEVVPLITMLAKLGYLREAVAREAEAKGAVPLPGYYLTITADPKSGTVWTAYLGWDLAMVGKLEMLQKLFPLPGQQAMTLLLDRLSGYRTQWEGEAALQKHLTLNLPAGTLGAAIDTVQHALNTPALTMKVDDATRALPLPAMIFADIPAAGIFQGVAQSADISCTIRDNEVKLMQWVR